MKSIDLEPRLKDLKWLLAIVLLVGAFAHLQSDTQASASLPREQASHTLHIEASSDSETAFAYALFTQSAAKLEGTSITPRIYSLQDLEHMVKLVEQSMLDLGVIQTTIPPRTIDLLSLYQMAAGIQGTVNCEKDLRLATPLHGNL